MAHTANASEQPLFTTRRELLPFFHISLSPEGQDAQRQAATILVNTRIAPVDAADMPLYADTWNDVYRLTRHFYALVHGFRVTGTIPPRDKLSRVRDEAKSLLTHGLPRVMASGGTLRTAYGNLETMGFPLAIVTDIEYNWWVEYAECVLKVVRAMASWNRSMPDHVHRFVEAVQNNPERY
ncbi:hypothetical protein ABW19_dt0203252 [Dactylella cylindrospora]|nr:hypothetical protein ABW19_dt0203252 [Dactylella cylindrospora]